MPLKCCYNCKFYDRDAHHQCREPQAEWVRYKEKANLCSYFVPLPKGSPEVSRKPSTLKDAKLRESGESFGSKFFDQDPKAKQANRRRRDWDSLFKDDD
jgi:uncharacterized OB-fold protein